MNRRALLSLAAVGVAGSVAGCTSEDTELPVDPTATLRTTMGEVTVDLHVDRAPRTVENFVGLATGGRE